MVPSNQPDLNLAEVLSEPVDWRLKSFPAVRRAIPIGEIGEQGWNALAGDFSYPVIVLKESALDHNIALMARYCERHGVSLAPHAKTPVSPQIVCRQLAAGAWGISVANFHQTRLFRHMGARRILMANQLLDGAALTWIAGELTQDPAFEFWCLIDSEDGIALMDAHLDTCGFRGRLPVLIELGVAGGRCGCRTLPEALALAAKVAESNFLQLVGVETYEGMVSADDLATRILLIDALIADVRALMVQLDRLELLAPVNEFIVSAGGGLFFDRATAGLVGDWNLKSPVRTVLRCGSYVAHDGDEYEDLSPLAGRADTGPRLRQAIELWAHVISRPEPGLAVLGFGKRDVAHDRGLPTPFAIRARGRDMAVEPGEIDVFALNDQHARARVRRDLMLRPGDTVGFHISHPCTTFDNWRLIPLVDDAYNVKGGIRCYL